MVDVLRENDTYVCQLREAIVEGAAGLADVPALIKRIIDEDRWRERRIKTGDTVPFRYFEEFVATSPIEGLGASLAMLRRLCKDDKEALEAIDRAVKATPRQGMRTDIVDNVNDVESRPTGNTEQAAIRRLRKDRPDLLERVKEGALSAHRAMVEAGFRRQTITIPDEPQAAARRLLRHFEGERLAALVRALAEGISIDLREWLAGERLEVKADGSE